MEPTVSVIIPVYNGEKTLKTCVQSFLNQTYTNLEIIIVDDGSNDDTVKTAKTLTDPRVRVVCKENGGPASARNLGIAWAKGELIGFADSDDWVEPGFLAALLAGFREHDCDLSVCGYFTGELPVVPQSPKSMAAEMLKPRLLLPQDRAWGGFVWNKLYKTALIRKFSVSFPEECTVLEDLVFNFRYLAHCKEVYLCREPLYHYNVNPGGLTKKIDNNPATVQKWLSYGDAFDLLLPYEQDRDVQSLLRMQKTLHISTAVRALHGCGEKNHPKYKEKQTFLRNNLWRFLLHRQIPMKKKVGAVLTAVAPGIAFALWNRGERV